MKPHYPFQIVAVSLLVGLLAIRCGPEEKSPPESNPRPSAGQPDDLAPPAQQFLRYFMVEPKTLDVTTRTYEAGGETTLFEPLTYIDINNDLAPGAAEKWASSPDGRTWTFHLRKTGRWSDGRPVTASDFVYSFRRSLSPEAASIYSFFYYDIKNSKPFNTGELKDPTAIGIHAPDDSTVVVETERPCPYLPYIMAYPGSSPVPSWQVEKYGRRWTDSGNCVSNSSFQLDAWEPDQRMVFTRNPFYEGPWKSKLERIERIFTQPNVATGTVAYENGEIDLHTVDAVELDHIRKNPVLSRELDLSPMFTTWYLFFQTTVPPFDKLKVRQAIAHAIDREALCKTVLQGMGLPAYAMRTPGFPGFMGAALQDAQRYDPDLARRLMAEAGYPNGRGFPKVDLWLRGPNAATIGCAQAIQGMLKDRLGISIGVRPVETKVYMDSMYQLAIPTSFIPFGADYPDPNALLNFVWHSQPRGYGRHDWKNEAYDRLVEAGSVELDPAKRMKQYADAERILVEDVGGVFVFHDIAAQLRKPYLGGFEKNRFGFAPLPNLSRLYVKKKG